MIGVGDLVVCVDAAPRPFNGHRHVSALAQLHEGRVGGIYGIALWAMPQAAHSAVLRAEPVPLSQAKPAAVIAESGK